MGQLGENMQKTVLEIVESFNGGNVDNDLLFDLILASHNDLGKRIDETNKRITCLEERPSRFWKSCGTRLGVVLLAAVSASVAVLVTELLTHI